MVDVGVDPDNGFDLSHSIPQHDPNQRYGGFLGSDINFNLFPKHPTREGVLLLVGRTPKGWMTFEPVPDTENEYRPYGNCDRWHSGRLITIEKYVSLEVVPGPNGATLIKGWNPKR